MSKKVTQPADDAGKKKNKKGQEPQTRQERRNEGKEKKGKKAAAQRDRAALINAAPGYTLAQLKAMEKQRPTPRPAEAIVLEEFLHALPACLDHSIQERLGIKPNPIFLVTGGDIEFVEPLEEDDETVSWTALRQVVTRRIHDLVQATQATFDGLRVSPEAAVAATEVSFEGNQQDLRLAEIIIADNPVTAIEAMIDDVQGQIQELQLIEGSLNPEYELERAIDLGTIDQEVVEEIKAATEEEVKRIGLRLRFEEIATGDGGEIDEMLAGIIGETAQAAETQRRERAQFRQRLAHGLRQRKEKEGRRYSSSPTESGDEEFIKFLLEHRGDLSEVRENLPYALREQVQGLLADEARKGPILRQIATLKATAQRRWTSVQSRLLAGADRPEETVAKATPAITTLRDIFSGIRELHGQLQEMDKPGPTSAKADYGTSRPKFGYVHTEKWGEHSGIYSRHLA